MQHLRIACRASKLSQAQFHEFSSLFPQFSFEPVLVESLGDKDKATSLLDAEAPEDFFTRELDSAVLGGAADAGLHSAKDLPWPLPAGLGLWWLGPGNDWDELVSLHGSTLENLPRGARVGTSSAARREGLLAARPDIRIVSIRGTIEERIARLGPDLDAVVVAACALRRLGLPSGSRLPFEAHPLQGRLALVGRLADRRLAQPFARASEQRLWGRVTIAGAGPGNPALVSRVVWERLLAADVVFHDALLDELMDELARELASRGSELGRGRTLSKPEFVFVGKRAGKHAATQEEINKLLWKAAVEGRNVVRLKGGDPLVLGRGSEEAEYLGRRLVSYELVPGISAAQTAASFAEIPLTERGRASSFAVVSGFPPERFRPGAADTRVYYMASSVLGEIGRAASEPAGSEQQGTANIVAAVSAAGTSSQLVRIVPASEAETLAPQAGDTDTAPILYVTGPTIDSRAGNGWFDRLPRVLYTGLYGGPWLGERWVHRPYIAIRGFSREELAGQPGGADFLAGRVAQDLLVFTSRHAVQHWFGFWSERGIDARALAGKKIAAIGAVTAAELRANGIVADIVPPAGSDNSQGLAAVLGEAVAGGAISGPTSVLLPRSARGLDLLPQLLGEAGFEVTVLELYDTELVDGKSGHPGSWDEIVFSSPSAVESYKVNHPEIPERVLVRLRGPQTGAAFAALYPEHPEARK